eukprot:TRINITY_DN8162_c0_g1_i1.p1 TRINITY_DN8162_c0_g1~~TRINITY_DN8162_c0_g1_i1.p1  ORF type:complete len:279 (+),score=71.13 TRINITY_DN8162_c0_g1_i1:48-839(+)
MATATAGRSAASRVSRNKYVPHFSLWRSIMKTVSFRNEMNGNGGTNRLVRTVAKLFGWATVLSFPGWLLQKYGLQELVSEYYGNGDPRWLHAPSINVANYDLRALPWSPDLLVDQDPWKVYVPRSNAMHAEPWEQLTRPDGPGEEQAWAAFGGASSRLQGNHGTTMQRLNLLFLFNIQSEETSFAKFYCKTLMRSANDWINDLYYSYWYVYWNVPLEERKESLGQRYGRRITRRWFFNSGLFGVNGLHWNDGLLTPFNASTTW